MDGYGGTSIVSSTEGLGQESLPECYEVIPLTRQGQSLPQRPHCAWFFAQYSRSSGDHKEKFSFGIRCETVEVKNLYEDSSRHGFFANLRHSSLYGNKYLVVHFSPNLLWVRF